MELPQSSALESAISRRHKRDQEAARYEEKPSIRSVDDIRRVLAEHMNPTDPRNKQAIPVEVKAQINGSGGKFNVSSTAKTKSYRDIIIESLTLIRERMDAARSHAEDVPGVNVNGVDMKPAKLFALDGQMAVDPIIERLLGAKREGTALVWHLADGKFKYNVFEHKLTRVIG